MLRVAGGREFFGTLTEVGFDTRLGRGKGVMWADGVKVGGGVRRVEWGGWRGVEVEVGGDRGVAFSQ